MTQKLKIEFGSNGRNVPGWLCTDISQADICKPLPWPNESCEALYASHVFEHVSSPHAIHFLQECHRLLINGGTLRLIVPIVGSHMTRAEIVELVDATHGHMCGYNEQLLRTMLFAAGFYPHKIQRTDRQEMDIHHHAIGEERDYKESCRLMATKIV